MDILWTLRMILDIIRESMAYVLPAIPAVILLRLAAAWTRRGTMKKTTVCHELGAIVLFLYIAVIFSQTIPFEQVISSGFRPDGTYNLVPFKEIADFISKGNISFYTNVVGNILMFCPVGFLLPLLWDKRRSLLRTIGTGFLLSLFIETMQLFTCRATDVDDLILNTCGALIGYIAYECVRKLMPKFAMAFKLQPGSEKKRMLKCQTES